MYLFTISYYQLTGTNTPTNKTLLQTPRVSQLTHI